MSDDESTKSAETAPETARRAAAASRARRIGGRVPGAQPTGPATAAPEDAEASAPEPAPEPPTVEALAGPRAVPGWLAWLPAGVLGAGAVVMAVLMLISSHGVWWGSTPPGPPSAAQVNVVRDQVLAAAKSCVAVTNDYSYQDLNSYETKALACTTGKLSGQLRQTIESIVKPNAPRLKATQATQINRGGIEAVSPSGQWTILVFGQLAVTNTSYPNGRTDPFAATVRMEQVGGKWLISGLSTVATPLGN